MATIGVFTIIFWIMDPVPFCGMTADEIGFFMGENGFSPAYAVRTATAFYRKRVRCFSEMSGLPKPLKELLSQSFSSGLISPVAYEESLDGTVKYLFRTGSGKEFEAVCIPDKKRMTVCISSQAGCRMGCPFCLTGRYGFRGNLTAGEIINQVYSISNSLNITHIVFMGMGEPMDNLEEVLKACEIITSQWGFALSPRNVTVSSVGITDSIKAFLARSGCNLTLSLHSPFPGERAEVVPAEREYPAAEIIEMLKSFPPVKKRRFSIAYVMISGINDTDKHLRELIRLLKGSYVRINLLPYHKLPGDSSHSSSEEKMNYFRHCLTMSGISASIRRSRGEDISAACGLLASGLK